MSLFNNEVYKSFLKDPESQGFTYKVWKEWYSKQLGKEFKKAFPSLKKKYFAKYLLYEGKGDINCKRQWYNNVQNTGWEDISRSNMDAIIAHGLEPQPQFRRLKLFLCSRDNPDKPLGEISQNAVWVKENDEFSEKEVKISTDRRVIGREEYFDTENWETSTRLKYEKYTLVMIKCPCCSNFM